ncbi:TonB-dependent receptor [Acidithiobacillus thiooxidans]|uniref:TonB-dependent receptor domain-containing protein n=1 Tax=Acidithiobacillus thiooxidans TaxID=930 RepID=UPI001C0649C1|nr:TonB-dependent receptor [Acidithiobacillus thiooxidans]
MKKPQVKLLLIALVGAGVNVVCIPVALAQDASKSPVEIGKVSKITKNEKKAPLKATYTEHVISKKAIRRASPMQSAQSILATEPSINSSAAGPNGVRSTTTFRAFNSGQFSETFDGISLNGPFNGGATNQASERNAIPLILNDISGIKIHNGINNPDVNSYDSLGGTISYEPRKPSRKFGVSAGMGYGSFGTFNWNALLNTGSIDGFRSLFAYNRQTTNGWRNNTGDQSTNYYYAGILPYDHRASRLSAYVIVNRNVGYTPHSVPQSLIQQHGYGFNWPLNETYSTQSDTELTAILGDKTIINPNVIVSGKVFAQDNNFHRTSYTNPAYDQSATQPYYLPNQSTSSAFWLGYPVPPTYNPSAVFGSNNAGTDYHLYEEIRNSFGFQPKASFVLPHNLVTVGGNVTYAMEHSAEYFYGDYNMPKIPGYNNAWDEHDDRLLSSVYIQDNISLLHGSLHITPGIKYLYAYTTSSDDIGFYYPIAGTVANSQAYTSPTIGISYSPLKHVSVYASYGRNIKFPDIDAYYNNIGEQNNAGNYVVVPATVQPEYVTDLELGTRYQNRRASFSADVYREDFKNTFISVTNGQGLSSTVNGGASRYEGGELSAKYDFGHILVGRWEAFANYSYNQAVFETAFDSSYAGQVKAGQPLANIPKNMINVGMDWAYHGFSAQLAGKYVSSQYVQQNLAGTPSSLQIPSYFLMNLGLQDVIPIHHDYIKNVKLSLDIDNLLNRHYYPRGFADTNYAGNTYLSVLEGMPRFVFGSVTLRF